MNRKRPPPGVDPDATIVDDPDCARPENDPEATILEADPDATVLDDLDPDTIAVDDDRTETVGAAPPRGAALAAAMFGGKHPEQIRHFRILGTLGEGGMGVVYLAEQQEPIERRVALKIVHSSLRGGEALLRFNAERQAMARLAHPNVAALFEAGATEDGFPYFAMERVLGDEITDYCDKHRYGIRQRLELFMDVCAGVFHAHQKGILHRDLKPSNIMVTQIEGEPVPKIIDFGIAKAVDDPLTDKSEITGKRAIGTPAYMSPEALAGSEDLDTRTDVYALGVLLYELLLGSKPSAPLRVEKKVRLDIGGWQPAVRPITRLSRGDAMQLEIVAKRRGLSVKGLRDAIRGDLDWIVMKSVAEDRDDRYASVALLAEDIRRHLRFEPVEARPPSSTYRLRRFVRRNRVAVAGGALVALALVVGMIGTTIGLLRALAAEAEVRLEFERAEQEFQRAEQVAEFMTDLFRVSDPGEARGNSITARELLDRGAFRIERELADQPLLQARLMGTMENSYRNLGLYDEAVSLSENQLASRRALLGDAHPDVALTLINLGNLYRLQSRLEESESLLREALDILQGAGLGESARTATAHHTLASVLAYLGQVDAAEENYQRAIDLLGGSSESDSEGLGDALHAFGWFLAIQVPGPTRRSPRSTGPSRFDGRSWGRITSKSRNPFFSRPPCIR